MLVELPRQFPCLVCFLILSEPSLKQTNLQKISWIFSKNQEFISLGLATIQAAAKACVIRLQERYLFAENYDGLLIDKAKEILKNQNPNLLLILHLQGSHGPSYFKRYPKKFERFLPTCKTNNLSQCSQDSIFNTYDNTLLYTDFLLQSLIHTLNNLQSSHKVALLYLSDHGKAWVKMESTCTECPIL